MNVYKIHYTYKELVLCKQRYVHIRWNKMKYADYMSWKKYGKRVRY